MFKFVNNMKEFEQKCIDLFGECPLNFCASAVSSLDEDDLLYQAACRHYAKQQSDFSDAFSKWKTGQKIILTLEEARKRNGFYANAKRIVQKRKSTSSDILVDWVSLTDDISSQTFSEEYLDDELTV